MTSLCSGGGLGLNRAEEGVLAKRAAVAPHQGELVAGNAEGRVFTEEPLGLGVLVAEDALWCGYGRGDRQVAYHISQLGPEFRGVDGGPHHRGVRLHTLLGPLLRDYRVHLLAVKLRGPVREEQVHLV